MDAKKIIFYCLLLVLTTSLFNISKSFETKNLILSLYQINDPNIFLNVTQILECSYGSYTLTKCEQTDIAKINVSDNRYGLAHISIDKGTWGRYNFSTYFSNLRHDINVLNVTVGLEGYKVQGIWGQQLRTCSWSILSSSSALGDEKYDKCYLQVFENSSGIYNYYYVLEESRDSCNKWGTSDTLVELPVISFLNHIEKLKNSGIVLYGYDSDDTCTGFQIDWVFINISYFDLTYSNFDFYNFSNGEVLTSNNIKRGNILNVSSLFDITDVNVTYIEHNGTGTFQKYFDPVSTSNISLYKYWVNFTINTSDFSRFNKVGPISLRIFANNSFGGYNITYYKTFYLYGYSKLSEISVNDSYIYPGESIEISCKVVDANLSYPIQNYNVSFWINDNYIGSSKTDSNGRAKITYTFNDLGDYVIKCNISDESTLFYYASEFKEQNTQIKVLNLTLNYWLNSSILNFGDSVLIKVNVTNASEIKFVNLTLNYTDIIDGNLVNASRNYTLNLTTCYLPYLCEFSFLYTPPRSGNYSLSFEVDASSPYGIVENFTSFFVNFGNAIISIEFPNFEKILVNQTFYTKLKLSSLNGDIWLVNVSLNSSDFSKISIDNIYYPRLISVKNSSEIILNFLVKSIDFGKVNLTANATPQYGNGNSSSKSFEVIGFSTNVESKELGFGNYQTIFANITGNATEIKRVFVRLFFFNISNCKLNPTFLDLNFSFYNLYFENQPIYQFNLTFIPPRSGNYSAIVYVETSNISQNKTEDFLVSFGNSKIFVLNPFYYVLTNQTFNLTIGIEALDGDLWFLDTNISILNPYAINLTENENNYHSNSIEAIANGTYCIDTWKSYSNYKEGFEITTLQFFAYPKNGTSYSYSESFEIILPNFVANPTFIEPNITFIDEYVLLKARVFGNASEFLINASIIKPYDSGFEIVTFSSAIPKNYSECGISIEKGNVASMSKGSVANASINNEDSSFAVDENLDTYWSPLSSTSSQLNISFSKIYTLEKIEITWKSLAETYANISYIDASDNLITLVQNVLVNSSKSSVIFKPSTPFKTKKIVIDFSNILAVYEVQAYPLEPRIDYCYEFYFNLTNFTRSGNYNVSFEAITSYGEKIYFPNSSFFINYGIPILEISKETYPVMLSGQKQNYTVMVKAYRGDVKGLIITFNSSDQNYINITFSESFEKSVEEILWNNSTFINWEIDAKLKDEPNITILTYVNASCTFCYSNNSKEFNITIYPLDLEPPKIENFWFKLSEKETSIFNLFDEAEIIANVTDNIFVKKVLAEIHYPNETIVLNSSMKRDNLWIFSFSDEIPLNVTGNFSVRIYAFDLNETHNFDVSDFKNFSVVDIYFIDYEPKYAIFNFGEKIVFFVKNVNNLLVRDVFWSEPNYNISNISTYFEIILSNQTFSIGSISLNVSANKLGNKGYREVNFELSKYLMIEILSPPSNYIFEPGISITGPGLLPSIKVYNVRKDKELTDLNSYVLCYDSSYNYTIFNSSYFYFNACGWLNNTYSFKECTSQCYAPNQYNTIFNISFLVFDDFGNEGFNYVVLRTSSLQQPMQSGGGMGGFGGFPAAPSVPTKECKCNSWENVGCGKGKCKANEMYQTRICNPSGCDLEERCIPSLECIPPKIEVKVDENITIIQGYEKTMPLIIRNVGEREVFLEIYVFSDTINSSLSENQIHLKLNDYRELPLLIKSSLKTIPTEHSLSLNIYDSKSKELIFKKLIKVFVLKNRNFEVLIEIQEKSKELFQTFEEYRMYGLLSQEELETFEKVKKLISDAFNYFDSDNTDYFEQTVFELVKTYNSAERILQEKYLIFFFSKHQTEILGITVSSLILYYFISQVILPYLSLSRQIRALISEEQSLLKARLELQKQYFTRKISEELFKKMIAEKQSKILEIRGRIKTLRETQDLLLKERLNPLYALRKIKEFLASISQKIKSSINKK